MRIIIEAEPKDIAALVVGLHGLQIDQWSIENLGEAIRDTLLREAEKCGKHHTPVWR